MSQEKKFMLAMAGAGAIGAAIYAIRGSSKASNQSPNLTRDMTNMGLEVMGTADVAEPRGNENAIDPSQDRKSKTTAPPEELLASVLSGGVESGPGTDRTGAPND
ncbi:hypothetical protein NQ176_g3536 [Zarea fungicola]|uniref:Uncharacterized protein n=1 Tax=Zarea fungicola TaxID=93591 RepID=A0ACC1NI51_9HYPO|nr:hypothetical protein NQ176_g3536 [Lecanicillium fungicola]